MRKLIVGAAIAMSFGSTAYAALQEEAVTYKDGDTIMKGFIVYDDASKAKRPGIVVVHEWWGITRHVRDEARKFAGQGYTAFVADMYGDARTADNPTDAGALSGSVRKNPAAMQSRFNAAKDTLAKHATVDASRSVPRGTASEARWFSTWHARGRISRASRHFTPDSAPRERRRKRAR